MALPSEGIEAVRERVGVVADGHHDGDQRCHVARSAGALLASAFIVPGPIKTGTGRLPSPPARPSAGRAPCTGPV
jgi:hypothetical protein